METDIDQQEEASFSNTETNGKNLILKFCMLFKYIRFWTRLANLCIWRLLFYVTVRDLNIHWSVFKIVCVLKEVFSFLDVQREICICLAYNGRTV